MNNKITYHREGYYSVPDLIGQNSNKDYHIGKYGGLRPNYLKEHKRGLYTELMISGELSNHLASINEGDTKQVSCIINRLAEAEGIDEDLK